MIKWHKANALPATPTTSDDGIWFIKKGADSFDVYIISEGEVKSLDTELSAGVAWGNIEGLISNQTDLMMLLGDKADKSDVMWATKEW